ELIRSLPDALEDRARIVKDVAVAGPNSYVLYWMQHALRVEANPALETACFIAHKLNKPLLIFHDILVEGTARQMAFVLQGALEIQQRCEEQKLSYAAALSTPSEPIENIVKLAASAAVIITEDMPTLASLKRIAEVEARFHDIPFIRVDAHCVLPPLKVGKLHTSLESYREETQKLRKGRFGYPWPVHNVPTPKPFTALPRNILFLTLSKQNLPELVSLLEVDQTVPATMHFYGGTTKGNEVWAKIAQYGIDDYPTTKRYPHHYAFRSIQPYLRYGMVSPFLVAKDACLESSDNAWSFIENVILWREYCYNYFFCRRNSAPTLQTPQHHKPTYSFPDLCAGNTDDAVWNKLQQHFRDTGVLHEHLFSPWLARLYEWNRPDIHAAHIAEQLYRRYALDRDDPVAQASFQQLSNTFPGDSAPGTASFQSPFAETLYNSLDKTAAIIPKPKRSVAIVGAGVSGLAAAQLLKRHGHSVSIFDKAKRSGGRIMSKKIGGQSFDRGAPLFTATYPVFRNLIDVLVEKGAVQQWQNRMYLSDRTAQMRLNKYPYIAVPSMSSLADVMGEGLEIKANNLVSQLVKRDGGWSLFSAEGESLGFYDYVILAMPAAQAAALLTALPQLQQLITSVVEMQPVWSVMMTFSEPLRYEFDSAAINEGAVAFAFRENSKPGREIGIESWLLQSSYGFAKAHERTPKEQVIASQIEAFTKQFNLKIKEPVAADAHFWRYAKASAILQKACIIRDNVGVCGDWCLGRRLEDAFVSGTAIASRIIHEIANK
ncbi:MAG: FAD-dependent oxidoreductase, partial [Alphaproteobacteria bacterium]|nr:FAD-dependent oxidoreductase [Alphaproteobacteria bacterium]